MGTTGGEKWCSSFILGWLGEVVEKFYREVMVIEGWEGRRRLQAVFFLSSESFEFRSLSGEYCK